ncbi:MAG: maleylpyruvate isomerase N-terminal domain-containing protein [Acidimicrobiia bacterium]|nr:maleylpyruvate isomerase N-terminal domain-containing protein [Acidimicrobiia bacterium]
MERRWVEPSVLTGYTVGGLAAHLLRAVSTPLGYLDQEATDSTADADAAHYFLRALGDHDPVDSDLHRAVRQRSDDMAASGPLAVLDATRGALLSLTGRLEVEPSDRVVVAFGGTSIGLDDYLETRIVELLIHADDLAESCPELGGQAMPAAAWNLAGRVVAEVAARRTGDRQFVLGLSRAERAQRPLAF